MKNLNATSYEMFIIPAYKHERLERMLKSHINYCIKRIGDCNWIIFDAPAWVRERDANNAEKELEFYSAELTRYESQLERIINAREVRKEVRLCPWV